MLAKKQKQKKYLQNLYYQTNERKKVQKLSASTELTNLIENCTKTDSGQTEKQTKQIQKQKRNKDVTLTLDSMHILTPWILLSAECVVVFCCIASCKGVIFVFFYFCFFLHAVQYLSKYFRKSCWK